MKVGPGVLGKSQTEASLHPPVSKELYKDMGSSPNVGPSLGHQTSTAPL